MKEESQKNISDDQIDLFELFQLVWSRRGLILKITFAFILLGIFIIITTPKEYTTSCILIPEAVPTESRLGGSIGGLASIAGIDLGGLGGSSLNINPGLYRSVAQSTPFLLELLEEEYYFKKLERKLTIRDYFIDYYERNALAWLIGLPFKLLKWIKGPYEAPEIIMTEKGLIALSYQDFDIIQNLKDRISVNMDWDLNIVSISVEMQDPMVAAQITTFTKDYITNYVTKYSLSKSNDQLDFINEQYLEKKAAFNRAQLALASFRDNNINVTTAKARTEEERLQSEYNLAFNIYNQIAQQRESIKMQLNDNKPVFTVLEPVKIPNRKSKPNTLITLLMTTFLGVFISVMIPVSIYFFKLNRNH
tara:strand:- start:1116 stop:2204 length:1089 start_codon:yes stop_codon:yes gene_type:complete